MALVEIFEIGAEGGLHLCGRTGIEKITSAKDESFFFFQVAKCLFGGGIHTLQVILLGRL